MIRISITAAAFDVIASTLPFCSVMCEAKVTSEGGYFVWPEHRAVDQVHASRQKGEDLPDVILRLAAIERSRPGRRRARK